MDDEAKIHRLDGPIGARLKKDTFCACCFDMMFADIKWNFRFHCSGVQDFFISKSGPGPGSNHILSFQTCQNWQCLKVVPQLGPVLCPVLGPKF